jgi:hypothetical protein
MAHDSDRLTGGKEACVLENEVRSGKFLEPETLASTAIEMLMRNRAPSL